MIAWCWWAAGACLLLALSATAFGILWSARPFTLTTDDAEGTYTMTTPDPGRKTMRGGVMLGIGLAFTTLAGVFALLAAPPWLEG